MNEVTVKAVDPSQTDNAVPPEGTAIIRPLSHVHAVRERYLQRFADRAEAATSRSTRAWAWALGETALAPVTDRPTATPPSRAEIEAEITEAEHRRVHGTREGRADAAATVLRWLLGTDDRVPVHCANPGELVGGFGDIVRSREQIAELLELAGRAQRAAATRSLDTDAPRATGNIPAARPTTSTAFSERWPGYAESAPRRRSAVAGPASRPGPSSASASTPRTLSSRAETGT